MRTLIRFRRLNLQGTDRHRQISSRCFTGFYMPLKFLVICFKFFLNLFASIQDWSFGSWKFGVTNEIQSNQWKMNTSAKSSNISINEKAKSRGLKHITFLFS